MIDDVAALTETVHEQTAVSISVSCQPHNAKNIKRLKISGVNRIGIPLDAATEELFDQIKGKSAGGPYTWETQIRLLNEAVSMFGERNVSTHLIVGLGETEEDMVRVMQKCLDLGVIPALFAFTPIARTALDQKTQPRLETYRRVQLARHLMLMKKTSLKNFLFSDRGLITSFGVEEKELQNTIRTGEAFRTSGCPDCNRPYYNEKPGGPIYNYPKAPTEEEIKLIKKQFASRFS
jgi:biotin synthase-related radical SAM superfamily protein